MTEGGEGAHLLETVWFVQCAVARSLKALWISAALGRRFCYGCSPLEGPMTEARKLAAILVADVVGYSRLAGMDEERTLARLRGLRGDLIDPAIGAHRGRIVKRTGRRSSAARSTRCAVRSSCKPGSSSATPACPRTSALSFASESMSATWWRRATAT